MIQMIQWYNDKKGTAVEQWICFYSHGKSEKLIFLLSLLDFGPKKLKGQGGPYQCHSVMLFVCRGNQLYQLGKVSNASAL